MNYAPAMIEAAGKVQRAIRENAIADQIKDALTDWQRENLDLSMRYKRADELNMTIAEYRIGKLLAKLFYSGMPDFGENAADHLRTYFNVDPDGDCIFDEGAPGGGEALSHVRATVGMVS